MYVELVNDRTERRLRLVATSWLATFATCGYLFPWAVATTRGKANADAIGFLNLALGWTIVGWLLALALACRRHALAGLRISEVC